MRIKNAKKVIQQTVTTIKLQYFQLMSAVKLNSILLWTSGH